MNIKSMLTVSGFLAALLLSAGASAGEQASEQFKQLDEDGNGQLSAVEASKDPELSTSWSRVDKDSSGSIDRSEFSAFETMQEKTPEAGGESGAMQ